MQRPAETPLEIERQHEDDWYRRAIREGFFEREGFRRLIAWNLRALERAVPLTPRTRVLSLGCGLGDYELAIASRVASILGVDVSPVAIEEASRRARQAGCANVRFEVSAIEGLDVPPGGFDLVYAMGVLHHVPTPAARLEVLRHARRWVAPEGWLYLRDPNVRGLPRRVAYRFFRSRAGIHSPNEDHLDPRDVLALVRQAGFRDGSVSYTDVIGGPLPWLVRSPSPLLWRAVFAFDRAWLATPGLRALSSQFAVSARAW